MIILAIETSNDVCGAALIEDGKISAEKNLILPKNSSSEIFGLVGKISRGKKISAVAVDIGPGSFTGIRIGVSMARAYSQFLGIPAVGIPSLDCMAYNAAAANAAPVRPKDVRHHCICPVIDALRNEVYTARFEGLKRKSRYGIVEICDLEKFFGPCAAVAGSMCLLKKISGKFKRVETCLTAGAVGMLALEKLKRNGLRTDYSRILPFYMRKSFAEERSAAKKVRK